MPKAIKRTAKKTSGRKVKKSRGASKTALRMTVAKKSGKDELRYIPWSTIPLEDLNPLLQRQFVVGEDVMVARVLLKKGCIVPLHSHYNEQLTYILEGALKFWIDGKEIVVRAGERGRDSRRDCRGRPDRRRGARARRGRAEAGHARDAKGRF